MGVNQVGSVQVGEGFEGRHLFYTYGNGRPFAGANEFKKGFFFCVFHSDFFIIILCSKSCAMLMAGFFEIFIESAR